MPEWLRSLIRKIVALREGRQRTAVFLSEITRHTGKETVPALKMIATFGWKTRSASAKMVFDTLMDAVASGTWPEAHFREVYTAAEASNDSLVTAMLPVPGLDSQRDSEEPLPIPAYSADRPLTLGERKSLAAKPSRRLISLALADPHPQVIEKLLSNPKLTENDVVTIATKRPTIGSVLRIVSRHRKWRIRPRVARALIFNPHTPPTVAVSLLHLLPTKEVARLEEEPTVAAEVRRFARELGAL